MNSCSLCTESFRKYGTLRNHMRTQTIMKAHRLIWKSCSLWTESYHRYGTLKNHRWAQTIMKLMFFSSFFTSFFKGTHTILYLFNQCFMNFFMPFMKVLNIHFWRKTKNIYLCTLFQSLLKDVFSPYFTPLHKDTHTVLYSWSNVIEA